MNATVSENDIVVREFTYLHTPWIELNVTFGLFTSLRLFDSDKITSAQFTPGNGTDTLQIGLLCGNEEGETSVQPFVLYSLTPGVSDGGDLSTALEVSVVNAQTRELLFERTVLYGGRSFIPDPPTDELYMFEYLSAPYALYRGEHDGQNTAFFIVNTRVIEGDELQGEFTPANNGGTGSEPFDQFNLAITGADQGNVVNVCKVFGPFDIGKGTVGYQAGSTKNKKPKQQPVGIKSYGNDLLLGSKNEKSGQQPAGIKSHGDDMLMKLNN